MNTVVEIRLNSTNEVHDFCERLNRYEAKFELSAGRYTVNPKSIMSVFSLDLSRPLTLKITSELGEMAEILKEIKPYLAV